MEVTMNIKHLAIIIITPLLLVSCLNSNKSDWVVKVNKSDITKEEIQIGFNNLPDEIKQQIPAEKQGEYIINQLIQNEILYQEAIKNTLNLKEEYQKYVKTLTNQFEYQKKQGLIDIFVKETITPKIKVSEQEIIDAYEKNKDTLFKAYEERSISHIVVKTEKEALNLHRKLRNGSNFKTLAKTKSIDKTTATNNGKIPGKFTKENLSEDFKNAIFNLKRNGSYTKPIKSEAGYHIFKLDNKEMVKEKELKDVKQFIENQLFITKRNQEIATLLDSLKESYKIEQNKELENTEEKAKTETEAEG
tara:strand:- start:24277 stop:25188 length:912 start_codon:yes stop_codon:yes gene_type:complete